MLRLFVNYCTLIMVLPILSLAGDSSAGKLVNRGRNPELSKICIYSRHLFTY
jgi:hypothetical protein